MALQHEAIQIRQNFKVAVLLRICYYYHYYTFWCQALNPSILFAPESALQKCPPVVMSQKGTNSSPTLVATPPKPGVGSAL